MQNNYELAFNELEAIGCPVIEGDDYGNPEGFRISGEDNCEEVWANYYMMDRPGFLFGVNERVVNILRNYGLFAEWINPGVLGVYPA